jgi:3-hydroxyisobutyrate dehydrogenase-like beta-hydroxyacid dehydrogenase
LLLVSTEQKDAIMAHPIHLAFIGYGEVGKLFARQFLAAGAASVAAYDILFDREDVGAARRAEAAAAGVRAASSAADAAQDAQFIFSAVTADAVGDVAAQAKSYARSAQFFVDVNSASPETKRAAAKNLMAAGAHYIEAAVMAPVAPKGIATLILAGGPQAQAAAAILNPLGMAIRPIAIEYGRASATKLARSIMIKGIEALIIDSARAARAWDVQDDVFASLNETFPGVDFAALADLMAARVLQHGIRRAAEMREAADMLEDLGASADLARAVADAQERGAAVNADKGK